MTTFCFAAEANSSQAMSLCYSFALAFGLLSVFIAPQLCDCFGCTNSRCCTINIQYLCMIFQHKKLQANKLQQESTAGLKISQLID